MIRKLRVLLVVLAGTVVMATAPASAGAQALAPCSPSSERDGGSGIGSGPGCFSDGGSGIGSGPGCFSSGIGSGPRCVDNSGSGIGHGPK